MGQKFLAKVSWTKTVKMSQFGTVLKNETYLKNLIQSDLKTTKTFLSD